MPVYEYECRTCGHRFDARQSFSDAPLTVCPTCSGEVRRVFHPVGIVFKGSGWYVTDSRKDGGNAEGAEKKSEDKAETKAESKSEPKSESKTEAKSETKAEPAAAKHDH